MRSFPISSLLGLVVALVFLAGCSDDLLTEAKGPDGVTAPKADLLTSVSGSDAAPRSAARPVLRHPQLLEHATSRLKREDPAKATRRQAAASRITERGVDRRSANSTPSFTTAPVQGKDGAPAFGKAVGAPTFAETNGIFLDAPVAAPYARFGDEQTHLFLAFNEYEADGVTPRILDQWGITQRVLQEYGITRRVLQEYGITSRVLQEYGITRRVMQDYGGLTMELLEAYGITQRIMQDYGVTRAQLEAELGAAESAIRLRLRVSKAYPGISISFGSDLLDALLLEMSDDPDILFAEPDAEMEGGSFYLREGFRESGQMVPWNTARIGGVFTEYDADDVHVFLLDSGIYDRDLDVVEAKDFTMLFVNRDEETWDDNDFADMPVFDPGELGDPVDYTGHGTHVAGTIGAENNGEGIRGMAPRAKLHSLKVLTDQGRTDVTTVVAAIDYVTDFKQRNPLLPVVANLSLGMNIETTAYNVLDEAVKRATQFGVTVVVSAGNDGANAATYSPAHVAEAITVGSYDQEDRFTSFSNFGTVVDLLAPGDLVVSLTHLESEADADENVLMSGTSMAAPHVTAAAALYLSRHPQATPAEVQAALVGYSQGGIAGVPEGTTNRTVFTGFADDGETRDFDFTKAEYNRDNGTLKLEGEGPRIDRVTFWSGATGEQIASTVILEEGQYRLVLPEQEALFPCTVVATYDGPTRPAASASLNVLKDGAVFTDCVKPLAFEKAEWKDGDNELKFEGTGPSGYEITFTGAGTGDLIATLTMDNKGEFQFGQKGMTVKPCAIRATTPAGIAVDFPVKNAATDCGTGTGEDIPVQVTKAEWDADRARLTIEGTAGRDALVTAASNASGTAIGIDDADNEGRFKIEIRNPLPLPCKAHVSSNNGEFVVVDVIDKDRGTAPSKCEAPLQVQSVEWKEDDAELQVKATGLYNGTVQVRNGRNNALLHTLPFDHEGRLDRKVIDPAVVPCSVTLVSGGVSRTVAVTNPALYCDRNLTVASVQWEGTYRMLTISGTASATTPVALLNANTEGAITTTQAQTSGAYGFSLHLTEGTLPPCRVRVEASNGMSLAENVPAQACDPNFVWDGGEEDEGPEQNPYSFITISKAELKNGTLFVEGEGYVDMAVRVRNPVTGETLGQTRTDLDEAFRLSIPTPTVIPCSVEAELDGRVAVREVQNAPANCNNRPFLFEAEWNNGELLIEAAGGAGMNATLASPAVGSFYNAVFGADGTLNLAIDTGDLGWVPCTVRLSSNGQMMDLPVDGAPLFCDARAWVDFDKAEWDAGRGQLKLEGEGLDRAGQASTAITFTNAASGAVVHVGETDDNGDWQLRVNLATPPCTVTVILDNGSATLPVDRAPSNCRN